MRICQPMVLAQYRSGLPDAGATAAGLSRLNVGEFLRLADVGEGLG